MAADIEPGSEGTWRAMAGSRVEGDVSNGNVLFADKGGIEAAVNIGKKEFYEIIVELKD
jgi:beta-alanine degradation protein BauB